MIPLYNKNIPDQFVSTRKKRGQSETPVDMIKRSISLFILVHYREARRCLR